MIEGCPYFDVLDFAVHNKNTTEVVMPIDRKMMMSSL
jgi:hypothetical protein